MATLSNPTRPDLRLWSAALDASGVTVGQDLILSSAKVTGQVILRGARVGGQLAFEGATLSNRSSRALELEDALITGPVLMRPARVVGSFNLTAARVGGWYDDPSTWPTTLRLEGFVYEAIDARAVTPKQRLGWLRRHWGGYAPQPYEQLASVYRRDGNDQAALTVAIAKQQARRAQASRWWSPSRAWSLVLRRTMPSRTYGT